MELMEAIQTAILIILVYFAAYALIHRICSCVERCCYYTHCVNEEERYDGKQH